MNRYEVMFVIAAALEDDKKEATIETVKGIISDGSGIVLDVDNQGVKRLAYPIQKKNEGHYVLINFNAPTELPKELDRRLRISDDVVRHIIINKDEK